MDEAAPVSLVLADRPQDDPGEEDVALETAAKGELRPPSAGTRLTEEPS